MYPDSEIIGPEEIKGLDPNPVCSLEQHRVEEIFEYHEENFEYLKKLKRLSKVLISSSHQLILRFLKTGSATKKDGFRTIPYKIIVAPVQQPGC
jgi:hypothetical protein